MKVLHCSWIPETTDAFIQGGDFWLWVEEASAQVVKGEHRHPRQLQKADLIGFLENSLGLSISAYERRFNFTPQSVLLPTREG
ncbi:MAG: hypothetical protein ACK443_00030, partial [Methylococcaceae bacterium]